MKVLALNCSPLGSKGKTMLILEPFLQGIHDAGGEVELFHLASLNILYCRGKLECWFKTPGKCTLEDDMESILERMKKADVWVFATGVYWDGVAGLMKNFMDRLLPLVEPSIKLRDGRCHNPLREGVERGKLVLVSSCGHWSKDNFDLLISHMKKFSDKFERQFAGALLRPHIFALPHMMWLAKETIHIHDAANKAGREFVGTGKMQQKHLDVVSSELMPLQTYVRHMNQVYKKAMDRSAEEKRGAVDDLLKIKSIPHIVELVAGADKDLGLKIVETINRMGGIGNRADEDYQKSLSELRSVAKRTTPIIVRAYEELPEEQYLDRWSLVYLLGEIRDPESLSFFDKLLQTKMPPEKSKVLHQYSTKGEELIIRTTAIEAIKHLAGQRDERARELLLKQVRHELFSVRRAAVQSYLEIGGPEAQAQLKRILPEKDHILLKIKRKDVREIPQAMIMDSTGKIKPPLKPVPPREDERDKVTIKKKDDVPESRKEDKGDAPSGREQ
jgi:multimeric flavodoxin WrbA